MYVFRQGRFRNFLIVQEAGASLLALCKIIGIDRLESIWLVLGNLSAFAR